MTEGTVLGQEKLIGESEKYQHRLDSILSVTLTPEDIETYAETALTDLISLVSDVVDSVDILAEPDVPKCEIENAAFERHGLSDIEEILDHVSNKADEIRSLDQIISIATQINRVIVPTEPVDVAIQYGSGDFREVKTIPRLKTVLFVLANEFELDINNAEEVSITGGATRENMVRQTTYYSVEVPQLSRTILVCDEEGNATFILDRAKLDELAIDSKELIELSKTELNELISEFPELGTRIIYSSHFVERVVSAIDEVDFGRREQDYPIRPSSGEYLRPTTTNVPEGYLTRNGIAVTLGLNETTISRIIDSYEEIVGPTELYIVRGHARVCYSPRQQEAILSLLESERYIEPRTPEGLFSVNHIAKELDLYHGTIKTIIAENGSRIGEPVSYNRGKNSMSYYTPEQRRIIMEIAETKHLLSPDLPEGYMSFRQLCSKLKTSKDTLRQALDGGITEIVGQPETFRNKASIVSAYSPDQQAMIETLAIQLGYLYERVPEGYLSINGVAEKYEVNPKTIARIVSDIEGFGKIEYFRFGSRPGQTFSIEQQQMIREALESRGMMSDIAPEGFLTIRGIADKLMSTHSTVTKVVTELADRVNPQTYKVYNRPCKVYSPEDQILIEEMLREYQHQ